MNFISWCSFAAFRTPASPWDTRAPPCVGCVLGAGVFSLISGLPSPFSADAPPSLFEWFIGNIPLSDSSETYMRVVRPKPSPAGLLLACPAGVPEVSRFSCLKFLGVPGVYDYAGPSGMLALSASRPCCLPPSQGRRRPDCAFSKLHTPPTYTSVYASLCTSRCPAQNSRPSGSLLLSRKALSSSTSDWFIPAHWLPAEGPPHSRTERRSAFGCAPPLPPQLTGGWASRGNATDRGRCPRLPGTCASSGSRNKCSP